MNNSDFHIVNLGAYQTPEIIEDVNEDFIAWGDNNDFYSELIDVYLNSPTSHSIISGVVNQIVGKGFSALDSNRKPDEFAKFMQLFKKKDLKRIALDLKLLGEGALQVTYNKKKVIEVSHFNRETLRAEKCDKKGKINAYYYHPKWSDYKKGDKLTRIPVFGSGATNEVYIIRRHIPSMHYYNVPDWIGSLNYGKLECSISEYLVNEVENSFSGTKLVSFTNGVPTPEKQNMIKQQILDKLTGTNGEKVIVSFSDSAENKTTIEDISVSDAADVYQYISEECTRKLLLGHRITSPLLVGIRDGNQGLGSNADEIKNAQNLFENLIIKPYQSDIIDAIDDILAVNGIALKVYVQTLTPIEFTDLDNAVTNEQREEETGEKLQKLSKDNIDLDEQLSKDILTHLKGEIMTDYDLVEARSYSEDNQEFEALKLAKESIKSKPSGESILDKSIYKVRYAYAGNPDPERQFCVEMMKRSSSGVVYRLEDIDIAGRKGINQSFGHNKEPYDLFKYKGGKYCHHFWEQRLYRLKKNKDGSYVEDKALSSSEEVTGIPKSYEPRPHGHKEAGVKPIDMPTRGEYK